MVGFDNTHLAQLRHLWLTSVDIAGHALGRRAGEALLRRIDHPGDVPATHALMPATLHVRGSSVRLE